MEKDRISLWEEYLRWLDGLCACYQSIQQAQCSEAFQGRGVVVPEAQVSAALTGQCEIAPQPGFADFWRELEEKAAHSDEALARLFRHVDAHGLEQLAILLAAAPELNRKYERVFAYLQDDAAQRRATLGLAADLWALVERVEDAALFGLCDGGSVINRIVLCAGPTGLARPLTLREGALLFLTGAAQLPAALSHVGERLPRNRCSIPGSEAFCVRAQSFASECLRCPGKTGLLQLYGTPGTGRRSIVGAAADALGRQTLGIDCRRLSAMSAEQRQETAQAALSWCALHAAIPVLTDFDFVALSETERLTAAQELLDTFRGAVPLLAICARRPMKLLPDEGFRSFRLLLPAPTIQQQEKCWREAGAEGGLPLDATLDPRELSGIYTLTPGQIQQALSIAETDALTRGEGALDREAVALGVRSLCSPRLEAVAEPLQSTFDWTDLVVGDEAMRLLRQLCDRVRCRWQVNEVWGFDQKLPYGKGISVCLYGPPGTGKTMTAQVLSREFGLDAYRVDMSRIMDKYIGETEKKLSELFDAARDSNAILFFDEADALFTKRTEVGDSKDRYANVETAYLLQRMENHNGICILATNAVQNFDEAFKRRITYMIPLPMPNEQTRMLLWKKVFPPHAPLEGVDLEFFARRFELTGSSIKNVALSAAYLAAARGCAIGREELIRAVQAEYHKTGRVLMEHELY